MSDRDPWLDPEPEPAEEEPAPDRDQIALFDLGEFTKEPFWKLHWIGMPEFSQEDQTPRFSVLVHFESLPDLKRFSALVEQPVHATTQSIWFPEAEIVRYVDKRYAIEEAS